MPPKGQRSERRQGPATRFELLALFGGEAVRAPLALRRCVGRVATMCLFELHVRYRARSGVALGFCGAARVFAMGRVNYLGKPFVDEVISAILGAGVRLLC